MNTTQYTVRLHLERGHASRSHAPAALWPCAEAVATCGVSGLQGPCTESANCTPRELDVTRPRPSGRRYCVLQSLA
eukprot:795221-Prymnesium_polylepis.1